MNLQKKEQIDKPDNAKKKANRNLITMVQKIKDNQQQNKADLLHQNRKANEQNLIRTRQPIYFRGRVTDAE